jgi:hypothetical protein
MNRRLDLGKLIGLRTGKIYWILTFYSRFPEPK